MDIKFITEFLKEYSGSDKEVLLPCIKKVLTQGTKILKEKKDVCEWLWQTTAFFNQYKVARSVMKEVVDWWIKEKCNSILTKEEIQRFFDSALEYTGEDAPLCNNPAVATLCVPECKRAKKTSLICTDPDIWRFMGGYTVRTKDGNKRITNFTMDIIEVDSGVDKIQLSVTKGPKTVTIEIGQPYDWNRFCVLAGYEGIVTTIAFKKYFLTILTAELARIQDREKRVKKTDVARMEMDKIIACIEEDLVSGQIPTLKMGEKRKASMLTSGWYMEDETTVYLSLGAFCQRHRLKIKETAAILTAMSITGVTKWIPAETKKQLRFWVISL